MKEEANHEINRHLPKGVRRPGIRTKRKQYKEDIIEKGEVFLSKPEPFQMTLGDPTVPYGLWRAIEQMRRGEKSKIMVKPRYGYAMPDYARTIQFPEGWTEGEKMKELKRRRAFFEVKLIDWIVRHDLLGEGSLMKTIHERGTGYDRPAQHDEIAFNLKVFQKNEAGEE